MSQLTKKLTFVLVSAIMIGTSLAFNVSAEKIIHYHEPIIVPELCSEKIKVCRYNNEISNAIIDYFYRRRLEYNEAFHPDKPKVNLEDMLGMIYAFNEQNGMPLIIHLNGNNHYLIISSKSWSSRGKSFSINLKYVDNKPLPLFYYYNGEGNNVPTVIETWIY